MIRARQPWWTAQRGELDAELGEGLGGLAAHGGCRQETERAEPDRLLPAEEEVGGDVALVSQGQVLIDGLDAGAPGIGRRVEAPGLAVDFEMAGVRAEDPAEDLHQGRLACSVIAHHGGHRTERELDRDVVERANAAEVLADLAGSERDRRWGR